MTTIDKVIEIFREQFGLDDKAQIGPDTTIWELGGDSLDEVELCLELEDEFLLKQSITTGPTTPAQFATIIETMQTYQVKR